MSDPLATLRDALDKHFGPTYKDASDAVIADVAAAGVTLTQPQPDAGSPDPALDSYRDGWAAGYKEGCEQTEKAATPAAPKEDDRAE